MSTWHQQQAPVKLWHETMWTVATDPPGGMLTVSREATQEEAAKLLERLQLNGGSHSYIVPPHKSKSAS